MVAILGFDVILDMDELTAHWVASDCDLRRVIIPDTVLELGEVACARGWMHMCVEFRDEIIFKEGRM